MTGILFVEQAQKDLQGTTRVGPGLGVVASIFFILVFMLIIVG